MKKKLLLLGDNKRLITDFFMQMDFSFTCASTSTIASDMLTHYQFFQPDAVVYCMRSENRDNIISVTNFVEKTARKNKIPFIVIGDAADYEFLCKMPGGRADLRLGAGAPVSDIEAEISSIIIRYKNSQVQESKGRDLLNPEETFNAIKKMEMELLGDINASTGANLQSILRKREDSGDSSRPRILVVDDSTIIHKAIKNYLENIYDVSTAISGATALRFLQTKEVDVIILDYEMPEMDGTAVLTAIRTNPLTAHIPIIFLTGINDTAKIQKALKLKPDGYLLKPIDKNVLLDKLKEILG